MDAKLLIDEVNNILGTEIEEEEVDTIGGWFLTQNYEVEVGDEIDYDGFIFRVNKANLIILNISKSSKKRMTNQKVAIPLVG